MVDLLLSCIMPVVGPYAIRLNANNRTKYAAKYQCETMYKYKENLQFRGPKIVLCLFFSCSSAA